MDPLPGILIVGFVIAVAWLMSQSRYLFVIRIEGGKARWLKGRKVVAEFLQELDEVCLQNGLTTGEIRGVRRGRRIGLSFSLGFPRACKQMVRNVWAIHSSSDCARSG